MLPPSKKWGNVVVKFGKERILRSPLISRIDNWVVPSLLVLLLTGLIGCQSDSKSEGLPAEWNPFNGLTERSWEPGKAFIDPSELAVTPKGNGLLVPILEKLNTGIDEPDMDVANATDIKPEDMIATPMDYQIGKNDLVQVSIQDLQAIGAETVKQARVSESGNISLPLIGQVQAVGYTEAQLEQIIAAKYTDAGFLKNATVSVTVLEARARTFSILGSVQAAGQYSIQKSDFRILDALVSARDLTVDTDIRGTRGIEYIYILRSVPAESETPTTAPAPGAGAPPADMLAPRPTAPAPLAPSELAPPAPSPATATSGAETEGKYVLIDGKPVLVQGNPAAPEMAPSTKPFEFNELKAPTDKRLIRIPIGALKQGDLRYNIVVRPDDLIIVRPPIQGEYYMGGHVARTGVYSLSARKIALSQAIWSAGGLDQLAIPGRTLIRRRVDNNKVVLARVDLEKIFAGEEPDIYLKPDDVVEVGTNAAAPFIAAIRGGFRMTYGFGFLYDRNYATSNQNQ
jgi:polysaccharide export outer membrane protein